MGKARKQRDVSPIGRLGVARTGLVGPGCRSAEPPLPLTWQPVTDQVEVCQCEHREGARRVLGQTSVSHLHETPEVLDDINRMFAASPMPRSAAVDGTLVFGERAMKMPTPVDSVGHSHRPELLSMRLAPVRLIGEDLALLAVQQSIDLGDVRRGCMGRGQVRRH